MKVLLVLMVRRLRLRLRVQVRVLAPPRSRALLLIWRPRLSGVTRSPPALPVSPSTVSGSCPGSVRPAPRHLQVQFVPDQGSRSDWSRSWQKRARPVDPKRSECCLQRMKLLRSWFGSGARRPWTDDDADDADDEDDLQLTVSRSVLGSDARPPTRALTHTGDRCARPRGCLLFMLVHERQTTVTRLRVTSVPTKRSDLDKRNTNIDDQRRRGHAPSRSADVMAHFPLHFCFSSSFFKSAVLIFL